MMLRLTWSALALAALGGLASREPGDEPACLASRPITGSRTCCEVHRGKAAILAVDESTRRPR